MSNKIKKTCSAPGVNHSLRAASKCYLPSSFTIILTQLAQNTNWSHLFRKIFIPPSVLHYSGLFQCKALDVVVIV